jgi:hypothetical protein
MTSARAPASRTMRPAAIRRRTAQPAIRTFRWTVGAGPGDAGAGGAGAAPGNPAGGGAGGAPGGEAGGAPESGQKLRDITDARRYNCCNHDFPNVAALEG